VVKHAFDYSLNPFYIFNMKKITYKDYIGISNSRCSSISLKGMLILVYLVKPSQSIIDTVLRWFNIYAWYTKTLFWCPLKSTLSIKNYGSIGKKSRGIYSNLWYELTDANVKNLLYMTDHATQRFNFVNWIRDSKFQKVTNKKLKELLDKHLPK
jgi:hypothetical protein